VFDLGSDAFFSYTETDGDISLVCYNCCFRFKKIKKKLKPMLGVQILDTTSAEGFPEGTLTVSEDRWRAIEIYEGEAAISALNDGLV
jgi:hypothetical protein